MGLVFLSPFDIVEFNMPVKTRLATVLKDVE